uniref:Deoxyribonuclease II n=1 Tax=Haemonchus contortus TaxID=6289 RepID=A0A7I5E8A2_HAECO
MKEMLVVFLTIFTLAEAQFKCKNMDGKDVDWFAALKLPANIDVWNGRGFVYFDSTYKQFVLSENPLNSTKSAIGATLKQLYDSDPKTTAKIAYNDDCPGKEVDSGRGHSKGVAVFGLSGGFWLIHSVPNFPPPNKYDYPETGTKYAQSFLCLTLGIDNLEDISQYMRWSQVTPFITNMPEHFKLLAPHFEDVINKKSLGRSDTQFTLSLNFETLMHKKVNAFAKHKKFGADLWHDFIAPSLGTSMAVETWRNGAAKDVGTQCGLGSKNVYDVTSVNLFGLTYASSKDHSKWGVSMEESTPTVCIGDVNRQESQFKRGGGAVCIRDKDLWKAFKNSVGSFNDCGVVPEKKSSKSKDAKKEGKKAGKAGSKEKPEKKTKKTEKPEPKKKPTKANN